MRRTRRLTALLGVLVVLLLAAVAPALAESEEEPKKLEDEKGREIGACSINEEDFKVAFIQPKKGDLGYMTCPPDAYYLTYMDTRGMIGKMSDAVDQPVQEVQEAGQNSMMNSMASSIFVFHAKVISTATNVMLWAFGFNIIGLFEGQVKAITTALGNSIYKVLIEVVWGLAVAYGAYLSIVRDQVSAGIGVILKSAVIGSFGFLMINNPLFVVKEYQRYINAASGWVFGLVDEVTLDTQAGDIDKDGNNEEEDNFTHPQQTEEDDERGARMGIAYTLWRSYVHEPFVALQIDSTADMDEPNSEPFDQARDLLDIKYPDDRRNYLCEIAECPLLFDAGGLFGGDNEEEEENGDGSGGDNEEGGGDGEDGEDLGND